MKTKLIKKLNKKTFKRTNWILKLKKTKIYNKLIKIISNKCNKKLIWIDDNDNKEQNKKVLEERSKD